MATIAIPTELTNGWQVALERWSYLPAHDTILGLAAKHKQFAWLAARYRDAARTNPTDTIAPARLERLRKAALVVAFQTAPREQPEKRPFKAVATLLLAAMFATGLGLWVTDHRVHQGHTASVSSQP